MTVQEFINIIGKTQFVYLSEGQLGGKTDYVIVSFNSLGALRPGLYTDEGKSKRKFLCFKIYNGSSDIPILKQCYRGVSEIQHSMLEMKIIKIDSISLKGENVFHDNAFNDFSSITISIKENNF